MSKSKKREKQLYMVRLAEQAERFGEMLENMKGIALQGSELSVEERHLLSVAYKNMIGTRRTAWRIISSIEKKEVNEGKSTRLSKAYRETIENEIRSVCNDLLNLLETQLLPSATSGEPRIFYQKMKGDYHRYLAELKQEEARKQEAEISLEAYMIASDIANAELATIHPVRLGLALNFSVFYYEIMDSPDRACQLAKTTFDEAIADLGSVSEAFYKETTLILQLLRENLTLWTSEKQGDEEANQQVENIDGGVEAGV